MTNATSEAIAPGNLPRTVNHAGRQLIMEVALSAVQLEEAKALDDLVFEGHQGISMDELEDISKNGAVILLRDESGELLAETQVVTVNIARLPHPIAPHEAYDYGTAVHPDFQGSGLGGFLYKAQEAVATEAGKTTSVLSVRAENMKSLRARFKAGFTITGYDPAYFGPRPDDARVIVARRHVDPMRVTPVPALLEMVESGATKLATRANVKDLVDQGEMLGVPLTCGDEVDLDAHELIAQVFDKSGYQGIGLLKAEEVQLEQDLLIFKKLL